MTHSHATLSKQASIAAEIKTALASGDRLTSAELSSRCHTALDSTDISRVIGDLKSAGLVAQDGTKKSTSKGGTAKAWAWIGPPDAEVPKSSAHRKHPKESIEDEAPVAAGPEPVVAEAPAIEVPCGGWHAGMQEPMTDEQMYWSAKAGEQPRVVGVTDWKPVDATKGPTPGAEQKWVSIHANDDPTELALNDLVDQVGESLLSLADTILNNNQTYVRLLQMQDDAIQLLGDYRLIKTLEKS